MDELRKKLDELTALRNKLIKIINDVDINNLYAIESTSDYGGKLRVIAQNHRRQFNEINITRKAKIEESQRLAKESQRLAKESQRVARENITNYKNNTKLNINNSTQSINILVNKINIDIKTITTELTKLITLNAIRNLCTNINYNQKFLETYLASGRIEFTEDTLEIILVKIKSQCDWHYPALQINPESKKWIDCMIAADPLYLINHATVFVDKELLYIQDELVADIILNYPVDYQRRVRIYDIQDQNFSALPQEQFGIIFCSFLNSFKIEIIKRYLSTFFKLSRPGGKLICTLRTVHPCTSNTLVEQEYHKYTSELVIRKLFEHFGYEIDSITDLVPEKNTWECVFLITARKPGVLSTVKAHQVLGSIIEK